MDQLDPLKRSEDKTLEFKRHLSSPDRALKTIVAFANTAGGILLIGVEDRRRDVLSVAKPLEEEERLANLFSDRISPLLLPEIEILPWRQTQVLALQVYPSPSRRHHLIREGPAGGVDVRVGSTNRADAELIEALQRFSRGEGFDEQPLPSLSSEAIDVRAASESFAPCAPSAAAIWSPSGSWPTTRGRGSNRLRADACLAGGHHRRGSPLRPLEPTARGRARGPDQCAGPHRRIPAGRIDPAVDLR